MPLFRYSTLSLASVILTGCLTIGPDHQTPEFASPASFRNPTDNAAPLPQGNWWKAFHDEELTRLLEYQDKVNPNVAAALARLDQVRAELGIARAGLFPTATGDGSAYRKYDSENAGFQIQEGRYETYRLALNLTYEVDLWGRVRRSVQAADARHEAAQANYANAMLALKAELARHYYSLRFLDEEKRQLDETVRLREEGIRRLQDQRQQGEISGLDVSRAEAELATARAEAMAVSRQRDEFQNAIAVAIGDHPSSFELAAERLTAAPPVIPAGVPSELLRRRPDVLETERLLAAATADIGVAQASFLPRIRLTGLGGVESLRSSDLFQPASKFWEIGPEVDFPLFQAGRSKAEVAAAKARFEEALATHRQTVLEAFRETENALNAISGSDRELVARDEAASAATNAAELSRLRHQQGLIGYLEVIDAERIRLENERLATQARSERYQASVALIQALGGGWEG